MLVVEDTREGMALVEVRRRDVWLCRSRAGRLDRELAGGLPPEGSRSRALWACLLVTPRERRSAARALDRILGAALHPDVVASHGIPLRRDRIRAVESQLRDLVARLRAPRPVTAAGMAQVRVLLTDGGGPLHGPGPTADLERAVERAVAALDAGFDWGAAS